MMSSARPAGQVVLLVNLFAENECYHVGILLNDPDSRSQPVVAMISAPAFWSAAQLRERNDRYVELLGQRLQPREIAETSCVRFRSVYCRRTSVAGSQR